jgi:hypothetical protein
MTAMLVVRREPIMKQTGFFLSLVLGFVPIHLRAAEAEPPTTRPEPQYRWTLVTDAAAFSPRDGAGALVHDGALWLLGGWNPADKATNPNIAGTNNEVWRSVDGERWTRIKPNTHLDDAFDPASDWEARHTAGYVVHQGKMWIVGGDANLGHYQSDVWNSTDGVRWTRVAATVPWAPRILHSAVAHAGKIWVFGGQVVTKKVQRHLPHFKGPTDERGYNDVWNSTDGVTWTRVTEHAPWAARGQIGGAAVKDGRIWVISGGTYYTECQADVWSSADGVDWVCHTRQAPWTPRQYHDVAVFDGRLWILEGMVLDENRRGRNRNDVWHSADGTTWTEVPETPWKDRHAASVFVFKDALWMVAGNNMERDVWRLDRLR